MYALALLLVFGAVMATHSGHVGWGVLMLALAIAAHARSERP